MNFQLFLVSTGMDLLAGLFTGNKLKNSKVTKLLQSDSFQNTMQTIIAAYTKFIASVEEAEENND